MSVIYVSRYRALNVVSRKVKPAEIVLDLGPGICPQAFVKPRIHICIDAHRPYLERLNQKLRKNRRYVLINAKWDQVITMLPDKSVDTVFALDFIEHLEKAEGLKMLREAERVARRQIVVGTPQGFYPQSYEDPNKPDRWGMGGGYWQTHRSGWDFEDFGDRWDIVCCPDFLKLDEDGQPMEQPIGAIWAIRNLSMDSVRDGAPSAARAPFVVVRTILQQGLPPIAFDGLRSAWLALLDVTHRAPH